MPEMTRAAVADLVEDLEARLIAERGSRRG